jgi:dTDP-4-dehydrorhamnose reductase
MIGPELAHKRSFFEWFLQEARNGRAVKGYRRMFFSGLTTLRLAQITTRLIRDFPGLSGLYHVAGEAISKHDLLFKLREAYDLDVQIIADDELVIDRSLNASRFERATRMERPIWKEMIAEMAEGVAV